MNTNEDLPELEHVIRETAGADLASPIPDGFRNARSVVEYLIANGVMDEPAGDTSLEDVFDRMRDACQAWLDERESHSP